MRRGYAHALAAVVRKVHKAELEAADDGGPLSPRAARAGRERAGLTLGELAEMAGLTTGQLRSFEAGHIVTPTIATAIKDALDVAAATNCGRNP